MTLSLQDATWLLLLKQFVAFEVLQSYYLDSVVLIGTVSKVQLPGVQGQCWYFHFLIYLVPSIKTVVSFEILTPIKDEISVDLRTLYP